MSATFQTTDGLFSLQGALDEMLNVTPYAVLVIDDTIVAIVQNNGTFYVFDAYSHSAVG